jgi:hypothetical protein
MFRRSIRRRRAAAFVVAFMLALGTQLAAQSYLNAFRDGMTAIDQKRWADAARLMETAARGQNDTGQMVRRYGMLFESYLPHYFLGVARYEMGDYQGALDALALAEQQGAVKKNAAFYTRLQELRRNAQSRVVAAAKPATQEQTASNSTKDESSNSGVGSSTGQVASGGNPSGAQGSAAANGAAQGSAPNGQVQGSSPNIGPTLLATTTTTTTQEGSIAPPPGGSTTSSVTPPGADDGAENRALEQIIRRATEERQRVDNLPDYSALKTLDARLARADAAARRSLDEATQRLASAPKANAAALRNATALAESANRGFQEARTIAVAAAGRLTTELIDATTPYFAGDYNAARTALNRLNYPDSRFAAQARLFEAASIYALYVFGSETNSALRAQAEAQVRECRRIADIRPDARVFSPKFIEFFTATR